MPYNFAADSFHTNKLCSKLSSSEVRQTDGRTTTYSEREREFTFAKTTTDFSSVLSQCTRLTDRQTDRQTSHRKTASAFHAVR